MQQMCASLPLKTHSSIKLSAAEMGIQQKCGHVIQVVGLPTLRMSKHKDLLVDNGSLLIPRNTTIWIPLGLPHASSAIYKNADQFIPQRWLEPNAEYMPTHSEMFISTSLSISKTASTDVMFMSVTKRSS